VVPSVIYELKTFVKNIFNINPKIIGDTIIPKINISIDRPDEVGADRLVNSLAAHKIYGGPIIVVDFGTATTFDIVNKEGTYIGGIISPGVHLSMDALNKATARLPRIAINKPDKIIGTNTVTAMQSGIGKTKKWLAEYISDEATHKDSLMGWNSSLDTKSQIKIFFDSKEKAIEWAKRNNYQYFVEEPMIRKLKIKSYSSNFDMNKKESWTH
jgi:hypothetical protein